MSQPPQRHYPTGYMERLGFKCPICVPGRIPWWYKAPKPVSHRHFQAAYAPHRGTVDILLDGVKHPLVVEAWAGEPGYVIDVANPVEVCSFHREAKVRLLTGKVEIRTAGGIILV